MTIKQFTVRSSTPSSTEALNIWHAIGAVGTDTAASALRDVYLALDNLVSDDATFTLDETVRLIDETTGALEGFDVAGWTAPVVGTAVGLRAPDATAVLIAWGTGVVVDGLVIRGRTFLPYPSITALGEGQINGAGIVTLDTAVASALLAAQAGQLAIWSRPAGARPGHVATIESAAGRREYSYQGRRRN